MNCNMTCEEKLIDFSNLTTMCRLMQRNDKACQELFFNGKDYVSYY